MLATPEEQREAARGVKGYQDPILSRETVLLEFLLRLRDAKMLWVTGECLSEISFFAVVKKLSMIEDRQKVEKIQAWLEKDMPPKLGSAKRGGGTSSRSASRTCSPLLYKESGACSSPKMTDVLQDSL